MKGLSKRQKLHVVLIATEGVRRISRKMHAHRGCVPKPQNFALVGDRQPELPTPQNVREFVHRIVASDGPEAVGEQRCTQKAAYGVVPVP